MVTGIDAGSKFTRWTIGLFAQPKDSHMALKPTSPLWVKEREIQLSKLVGHFSKKLKFFIVTALSSGSERYSGKCIVSLCRHQTDPQTSSWSQDGICSRVPDLQTNTCGIRPVSSFGNMDVFVEMKLSCILTIIFVPKSNPSQMWNSEFVVRNNQIGFWTELSYILFSPQGPAALMTASGLKRLTTENTALTQRGGDTLLTSDPWPPEPGSCCWGRSGKPHASTKMRWLTLVGRNKTFTLSFWINGPVSSKSEPDKLDQIPLRILNSIWRGQVTTQAVTQQDHAFQSQWLSPLLYGTDKLLFSQWCVRGKRRAGATTEPQQVEGVDRSRLTQCVKITNPQTDATSKPMDHNKGRLSGLVCRFAWCLVGQFKGPCSVLIGQCHISGPHVIFDTFNRWRQNTKIVKRKRHTE